MPVTTNRSFCIPNTGDLPNAWGTSAINPNFQYLDALIGGTTTIALSVATTITLSIPPTTGTSSGAATQSQVALIKFTGVQTGNAVIKFTLPGYYIIDNRCTGTSYVQLSPASGGGNSIGAEPGKKQHVFFDGTDMDYINMPGPGTALDFHTNTTAYPPWQQACTVKPYLIKDGSIYTASIYPALAQYLGSTYGGDGSTTFGVPDERSRFRLAVDSNAAAGRVTNAISGINGTTFGSAGGDQRLQTHSHGMTDTHYHNASVSSGYSFVTQTGGNFAGGSGAPSAYADASGVPTSTKVGSITINNTGTGSSQNMPPAIVSFLALVKT